MTDASDTFPDARGDMTEARDEAPMELSDHDALRADIYRLLARLLREAPDQDLLGFLAELDLAEEESDMQAHWGALALAATAAQPEALERAHFRHLVGVIQGELMPYASWYLTGSLMEMPLVELRRDLKRLGYQRAPNVKEPEDHIAALFEVMAMLIENAPREQALFFQRHLAPWSGSFMADLARVDTPFYATVGHLGMTFLKQESAWLVDPDSRVSPRQGSSSA
ncbi:chaperone TorD involved in molybdoenzyme TorA maturation [Modicisalibacter ilicicola DSM 19980]|uniref:Chaperone TorD involved in molybdoenzyme TorA maturation n=1 Tax=Modicisalibacter ilicicola DSM 19980 TaxID=1121942 RepID=A0A1M4XLL9_9GAMM|nr:molecular chaperone TorD family protein [Halomonas ilicicola]SHE94072.1 chaperone TorD involved in molybdoenzyme TorA maturation [Halomonas ilicicola DSM 19980]